MPPRHIDDPQPQAPKFPLPSPGKPLTIEEKKQILLSQSAEEQERINQLEENAIKELFFNPRLQYRTPRDSPIAHNPVEEFTMTGKIVGNPEASSTEQRASFFSSAIASPDVDTLHPSLLRIGRLGQPNPEPLKRSILLNQHQREFFLIAGYDDKEMTRAVAAGAGAAIATNIIVTPLERARTLAQADFASLSAIQAFQVPKTDVIEPTPDNTSTNIENTTNATTKPTTQTKPHRPVLLAHELEPQKIHEIAEQLPDNVMQRHTKNSIKPETIPQVIADNTPLSALRQSTNDNFSESVDIKGQQSSETTTSTKQNMKQLKTKVIEQQNALQRIQGHFIKSRVAPYIQAERPNIYPLPDPIDPHSIDQTIIRRYSPYDVFVRKQIVDFDTEFIKLSQDPAYEHLSGWERAEKLKELHPQRFKNISIAPYSLYNHHLEFNQSVSNMDKTPTLKPLPQDVLSYNHSDFHRGFHRFYQEPRINSLFGGLRALLTHRGLLGSITQCSLYHNLRYIIPAVTLTSLIQPWKKWMVRADLTDEEEFNETSNISLAWREWQLADSHLRTALFMTLLLTAAHTMFTRLAVHKDALYQKIGKLTTEQMAQREAQWMDHLNKIQLFHKYSTLRPDPESIDKPEPTRAQLKYEKKRDKMYQTFFKKEHRRPLVQSIRREARRVDGFGVLFRGMRPMLYALLIYYIAYTTTYTATATPSAIIINNAHNNADPPVERETTVDFQLEIAKAVAPCVVSATIAQYAAYPFTTIRNYILAAGTPGYVTFNKNALPIPRPINVDQYRLPMRQVETLPMKQRIKVAAHEIKRQAGWRGFWRGASIIPLVRVPQVCAISTAMFFTARDFWPHVDQIIDSQHFYQPLPITL